MNSLNSMKELWKNSIVDNLAKLDIHFKPNFLLKLFVRHGGDLADLRCALQH